MKSMRRSTDVVITLSSRHMDVTAPLKEYAENKANKLLKYYDRIQEIEVIFDAGKRDQMRVELIVNAEHRNMFVVHHDDPDEHEALDGCVHKMERQLSEHKKKHSNRTHPDDPAAAPGAGQA